MTPADLTGLRDKAEAALEGLASGEWHANPEVSSWLWGKSLKGGDAHIADIRGWGYLTGRGHGALALDQDEATRVQNQWLAFMAAANPSVVLALLAENEHLREALKPFAAIVPSGMYPADGSEAEGYAVLVHEPRALGHQKTPDFTGKDLAVARQALTTEVGDE